jgi:TonB family protein
LRSKKVSLDERNKLLSDAVKVRGITFSLSPEIEAELTGTGASSELVEAIRQRSVKIKFVSDTKSSSAPVLAATPTLDNAFYRKRADENIGKGEFELAVNDYTKAIELNPKDAAAYLNRGRALSNKKSFDLAILDYEKTIELNPKESTAYSNRAEVFEKKGKIQQAIGDYQKAVELDANNESAKNNLKRLQDEQAKIEQAKIEQAKIEQAKALAKSKETEKTAVTETPKTAEQSETPKIINLGSLVGQAVRMVMPAYPPSVRRMNIGGQVRVDITLDENGNVTSANAVSGPQFLHLASEDAARKTKFRPAAIGSQTIKATGYIVYNFNNK